MELTNNFAMAMVACRRFFLMMRNHINMAIDFPKWAIYIWRSSASCYPPPSRYLCQLSGLSEPGSRGPPDLGRSSNLISTRARSYAPHYYLPLPPNFQTVLRPWLFARLEMLECSSGQGINNWLHIWEPFQYKLCRLLTELIFTLKKMKSCYKSYESFLGEFLRYALEISGWKGRFWYFWMIL